MWKWFLLASLSTHIANQHLFQLDLFGSIIITYCVAFSAQLLQTGPEVHMLSWSRTMASVTHEIELRWFESAVWLDWRIPSEETRQWDEGINSIT